MVETDLNIKEKYDLLRFNPKISPEEVITRLKKFNELNFNKTRIPVIEKRNEQLKDAGYDSDNWTFYECSVPLDNGQTVEQQMRRYSTHFPDGIEFLMIQGSYAGGVIESSSGAFEANGLTEYGFDPTRYTTFIRVRPNLIQDK